MTDTSADIQPGLRYDLPMGDYHDLPDWLGSTQLKRALPEQYDENSMSQAALDFGTLFHAVTLEPDNLDHYVPADAEAIGVKADGSKAEKPEATKAWRTFVADAVADGKIVIPRDWWERANRMRDAVAAHPEAAALVFGDGRAEVSAFAVDAAGLRHKARPDVLIAGGIVDLKSTAVKPGEDNLTRLVINFLYDLSAAHYLTVADLLGLDVHTFTWVFVNKVEPFRVTVADADQLLIERGRVLRARALERLTNPAVEPYQGATGRLLLTCPLWAAPYESEMEIA